MTFRVVPGAGRTSRFTAQGQGPSEDGPDFLGFDARADKAEHQGHCHLVGHSLATSRNKMRSSIVQIPPPPQLLAPALGDARDLTLTVGATINWSTIRAGLSSAPRNMIGYDFRIV